MMIFDSPINDPVISCFSRLSSRRKSAEKLSRVPGPRADRGPRVTFPYTIHLLHSRSRLWYKLCGVPNYAELRVANPKSLVRADGPTPHNPLQAVEESQ